MNLAEKFAVSTAATEPAPVTALEPGAWRSWVGPSNAAGGELEIAYVIQDYFGVQTVSAGVFAVQAAIPRVDDLYRSVVVDATGLIEQFSASNVSAVLAQSAGVLNLPRRVFLKTGNDPGVYRKDNVRAFVVSDPFPGLHKQLAELGRKDTRTKDGGPAAIALTNAAKVLDAARAERILPTKILRGIDGVFLYFSNQERYVEVECDNDGDIGIVMSDRSGNPRLWLSETSQLRADLAKIRAFLI